jgi:hypothetical protein
LSGLASSARATVETKDAAMAVARISFFMTFPLVYVLTIKSVFLSLPRLISRSRAMSVRQGRLVFLRETRDLQRFFSRSASK